MKTIRCLTILALLVFSAYLLGQYANSGSAYDPPPMQSYGVTPVVVSESFGEATVTAWRVEIARRFPGAVAVFGHGGDDGEWIIVPDYVMPGLFGTVVIHGTPRPLVDVIAETKAKYPGRFIVCVVCNPGHYKLDRPGVAYAMDEVWLQPDKSPMTSDRNATSPDAVGNIYEFSVQ